ncbi:hypothetical protein BGZ65_006800, partial [Modicella reniformis]
MHSHSPSPSPTPVSDMMLCDWTRNAANCEDADFIKNMLISSSVFHLLTGLFGVWLLVYRNRGFNHKIFTGLFMMVGSGIRPKPMDCLAFFFTIASFVKIPANLVLIFDHLSDAYWLRVGLEQLYWLSIAFAFSTYFVGLLYAMPVTRCEGIFAVYQPETAFGSKPLSPIHVLTPTTVQKNTMLVIGAVYPTLFGAGLGIASGALYDQGKIEASRILMICQHTNWVLIMYVMAIMFFYYGLKFTFILRANIMIAEAALKAPRTAFGFGINNLKSCSPARFLLIQLQITGFGGCAMTVLAGTLCLLWVLFERQILSMQSDVLPHTMAFFWTCSMAMAFFVLMALIAGQTIRNRGRGLHVPSNNMSHSCGLPSSDHGDFSEGSLQRQENVDRNQQNYYNKGPKPEILHTIDKQLPLRSGDLETGGGGVVVVGGGNESEYGPYMVPSLTPPPRPYIQSVSLMPIMTTNLRESVFGGMSPREDKRTSSPPTFPGFSMITPPLLSMRSSSRNNGLPRISTNSVGSRGTPTHHTTPSTSTTGSSSRLSRTSSKHDESSPRSINMSFRD